MMRYQHQWTDERVAILRERWAAGTRVILIAEEIGGGITKDAVIGKAARLMLGKHTGARSYHKGEPRPPRAKPQRRNRRVKASKPLPPMIIAPVASVAASRPCLFEELRQHHCRWPLWDGNEPKLYCGAADIVHGHSYCAAHHARAHT